MTQAGEVLTPELRARFIALRTALNALGVYDPVLGRFDSATVPRATTAEISDQLARVAEAFA
jgi:hypothetical protein